MKTITASQLQTRHKDLIEALKRGESVTLSYHGAPLGIIHPANSSALTDSEKQLKAVNQFFGMRSHQSSEDVEQIVRQLRKGRRQRFDNI